MAGTAIKTYPPMITLSLPSSPRSARIARLCVRATLIFCGLGEYADDAEAIASELVTNAIEHVGGDGTETIGVALDRLRDPEVVTVIVTDSSPQKPVKATPSGSDERGRGLLVVDGLSDRWGWTPVDGGKAVYATLTDRDVPGCSRSSVAADEDVRTHAAQIESLATG